MNEENKNWCEDVKNKTQEQIEKVTKEGITVDTVTYLGKLVDINKDIENINYWKEKTEMYRNEYPMYGARMRDSRGRYMDDRDSSYGRRGRKYRGHDMLDDVYETYGAYMEEHDYGNYGTSESMMKIEVMADSLMDFIHHLKKEAKTPEEKHLIDEKLKEIGRM